MISSLYHQYHYDDVIMTTMSSQITSLTVVYSTLYSDADQRKHRSSASLAFVWGIHRDRWIVRTKGQLRGKCFHLMTSSWLVGFELGHLCACSCHSTSRCNYINWLSVNSSPPSAAYMRQWTGSALVQVMACRLVGTTLLLGPTQSYYQLDH